MFDSANTSITIYIFVFALPIQFQFLAICFPVPGLVLLFSVLSSDHGYSKLARFDSVYATNNDQLRGRVLKLLQRLTKKTFHSATIVSGLTSCVLLYYCIYFKSFSSSQPAHLGALLRLVGSPHIDVL